MIYDVNSHLGTDSFKKNIIIQCDYNTINKVSFANATLCVNHTQKKKKERKNKKALILHNKVLALTTPQKRTILSATNLN